jgi:hypothetical protein
VEEQEEEEDEEEEEYDSNFYVNSIQLFAPNESSKVCHDCR